MSKQPTHLHAPHDIVKQLRAMMPRRPLSLSESLILAERQANRALALVGVKRPGTSLGWITELPRTEVKLVPRYRLEDLAERLNVNALAGATAFAKGRYLILVNKGDAQPRRRFTLAHEWKHLLDYTLAGLVHSGLSRGDAQREARQIEEIANYFAACLLMPKSLVRRAWAGGLQSTQVLAHTFDVSYEAMEIRLKHLGFLNRDDDDLPAKAYFRQVLTEDRPGFAGGSV
jgi:Zn-dependent peptidase ImmA (M78 family)